MKVNGAPTLGTIRVIMGLGNPGPKYCKTRHNIGYRVVDALASRFAGQWHDYGLVSASTILINHHPITLVKANAYMNDSGKAVPFIFKKGIRPESLLVVHDELEKKPGTLGFKLGGSHRGHNGLRSIMQLFGSEFARLRIGIGRPTDKENVATYVLEDFQEPESVIEQVIDKAVASIELLYR